VKGEGEGSLLYLIELGPVETDVLGVVLKIVHLACDVEFLPLFILCLCLICVDCVYVLTVIYQVLCL